MAEPQRHRSRDEAALRDFVLQTIREPGAIPPHYQVLPLDHAPTDADFEKPVDAQHVVIDTATPALWARIGGTWKKAVLA